MNRKQVEGQIFGKQLKYLRIQLDVSQEELAWRLGLTPEQISRLERGKMLPSYDTLVKLRKEYQFNLNGILDKTIDELPTDNDE